MTSGGLIMWLCLLVQQQTSAQNKTVRQRGRLLYEGLQVVCHQSYMNKALTMFVPDLLVFSL